MKKYYFSTFLVLWILQFGLSQTFKDKINFSTLNKPIQFKKLNKGINGIKGVSRSSANVYKNEGIPIEQKNLSEAKSPIKILAYDSESGLPSQFETNAPLIGRTIENKNDPYISTLINGLGFQTKPSFSFQVLKSQLDENESQHLALVQTWNGIPMHGAEYNMHVYNNQTIFCHGNASNYEINQIQIGINLEQAVELLQLYFKSKDIRIDPPSTNRNDIAGEIIKSELCFYFNKKNKKWELSYYFDIMPNQGHHWEIYMDASSGLVKESISNICTLFRSADSALDIMSPCGSEIANANDLSSIPRVINTWKEGNLYYLIDASRPMFNTVSSQMPLQPVGAIVTQNGNFKHPENVGFKSSDIISTNNSWLDKSAVSAHYNTGLVYDYYLNKHNRNSLNGNGGTILSYVNVSDQGGQPMEDAFWNGKAMFYGNGGSLVTALAKALDVCGHEITHGVIQNTANLINKDESGAINESFADIFGVMIDRDDWKIGEDIVKSRATPTGALRDLSNPNNGGFNSNQFYWQPKHMNEKILNDTVDNGRIHTNSGIPNYAYYLFVQELKKYNRTEEEAKLLAEKIYYNTLKNYLSRSATFSDLRIGVERCAFDLFGTMPDVLASVKKAFDLVGILSETVQIKKSLPINPGKEFIVYTNTNKQGIYLYDFNGTPQQLSSTEIISKPSVTDNGSDIYFVSKDNTLHVLELDIQTGNYVEFVIDDQTIYRNVAISKDGTLLAVLHNIEEPSIWVYDFIKEAWKEFNINQGTTGTNATVVRYADGMDFDHSGQNVLYDAMNRTLKSGHENYEYWDIATIQVFDIIKNNFAEGKIVKLFANLEENTNIGNPVFAKNSTDVIAFDFMKSIGNNSYHYVYGVNKETKDVGIISKIRNETSYPCFSIKDDQILCDSEVSSGEQSLSVISLNDSKVSSNGSEKTLLSNAKWGSWFANGTRNLIVNKDIQSISQLEISPNPFNHQIRIDLHSNRTQYIQLHIHNQLGQLVFKKGLVLNEGLNSNWINLNSLVSGLYYVKLINSQGELSSKLLKN